MVQIDLQGVVVLVLGVIMLAVAFSLWNKRTRGNVADRGGVNVGGANNGIIQTNYPQNNGSPMWERILAIVGSIASIIGLYLTLLPPAK